MRGLNRVFVVPDLGDQTKRYFERCCHFWIGALAQVHTVDRIPKRWNKHQDFHGFRKYNLWSKEYMVVQLVVCTFCS